MSYSWNVLNHLEQIFRHAPTEEPSAPIHGDIWTDLKKYWYFNGSEWIILFERGDMPENLDNPNEYNEEEFQTAANALGSNDIDAVVRGMWDAGGSYTQILNVLATVLQTWIGDNTTHSGGGGG